MGVSFNAASLLNGNGIAVSSVVTAILSPETATVSLYQNQQTDLATQAGLLAGLNNNLATLEGSVVALADPNGALAAQTAVSSDTNILSATAASTALAGSHQITVSSLATVGSLYTNPVTDGNTSFLATGSSSGDIKLQVGGASGATHDIAITQGSNDTLSTLATYINKQQWGVRASVVTDANGARLALYSQSTGTPGALAITANSTAASFNPPAGGTNASLTIDGVPFSSATNTVSGAITGVTLNLSGADPSTSVQLTVGPDAAAATGAINNFVTAYNAVVGILNTQFTVNPATNAEGPLGSDSALRSLQSSLQNDVAYAIGGNGGLVNLASLGIDLNNDGTLTVNQTATPTHPSLANVLASNPAAVQSFFQNTAGTGFANNFNNDLVNLTDPTEGIITLDLAGNTAQQAALTKQINDLQDRITAETATLTLQYDQVNATLEAYPSLLLTVTSEIGALNGNYNTTPTTQTNTAPAVGNATG
jgi:flagellar hook-associated protein 2